MNIIIPANNEATLIATCLGALLASQTTQSVRVIVVANGCTDDTVSIARKFIQKARNRGWELLVLDLEEGGKPNALNMGDAKTKPGARLYLDADVIVSALLIEQISNILDSETPIYASGIVQIPQPRSIISRAYARIYAQVPFMTTGVPGCGVFAVNQTGRARWGEFPDIIADDTFVRLNFKTAERVGVQASYQWPVVEGWAALLRVRRRQNAGVSQINATYPALMANDDKPAFGKGRALKMALKDPIGFAIYAMIGLLSRGNTDVNWSRGR